jgi:hypothetical protein
MRLVPLLLVTFLLAGCALPPALTLASFAADGISYVATGKSTTDHAISVLAQEDCAMLRALEEQAICVPRGGESARWIWTEPSESDLYQPTDLRYRDD